MKFAKLAHDMLGINLPLTVLKSNAGFYIGSYDEEGPVSRESVEYWKYEQQAKDALATGQWTQRPHA